MTTTTPTPTHDREAARAATLERYERNLMDGTRWALVYQSERGQIGYRSMLNPNDYAAALAILADLAREGGMCAELASAAVRKINLYGTVHDMVAAVADAFAETMRNPYDDVAARTGPEPVRYSTAQKPWPLRVRLIADCHLARIGWLTRSYVPGYGWCLTELCERERVYTPTRYPAKRGA